MGVCLKCSTALSEALKAAERKALDLDFGGKLEVKISFKFGKCSCSSKIVYMVFVVSLVYNVLFSRHLLYL